MVVATPSGPTVTVVTGGGSSTGVVSLGGVAVSVTVPESPAELVNVTANPPAASSAAAAATPNSTGGRLYQGSGARSYTAVFG
ncbi:hypothetical protein ASJ79_29785 [Mycobacterium sp. NAZ190054]|nr:hypothetical protein ASJ79_29785 [Mycobacterium sp. NAZ190054]